MKRVFLSVLAISTLTLFGCGENQNAHTKSDPGKPASEGSPKTDDANGGSSTGDRDSDPYFDAFAKSSQGSCEKKDLYISNISSEGFVLKQDDKGRDVIVEIYMFMNPDHTYEALYNEFTVTSYLDETKSGFYHSDKYDVKRTLTGRWSVASSVIIFENLGTGIRATYNELKAIDVQFTSDQISSGLIGHSAYFRKGRSRSDWVHNSDPCASK